MKKRSRSASKKPSAPEHRSILCVDPDASYADILRDAWSQLHLADELHVLNSRETALEFLGSACGENGQRPLAAVVLDPEATGEETGPFVREVRKHCGKDAVPIVFWSQDGDKYRVLEGRGVESVLKKPMVLRLIQELDAACQLRVQSFLPYNGSRSFTQSNPRSNIGARA